MFDRPAAPLRGLLARHSVVPRRLGCLGARHAWLFNLWPPAGPAPGLGPSTAEIGVGGPARVRPRGHGRSGGRRRSCCTACRGSPWGRPEGRPAPCASSNGIRLRQFPEQQDDHRPRSVGEPSQPSSAPSQAVPDALAVLDSALHGPAVDRPKQAREGARPGAWRRPGHAHGLGNGGRPRESPRWSPSDGSDYVDVGVPPDVPAAGAEAVGVVARGDMGWRLGGGRWLVAEMDGADVHSDPRPCTPTARARTVSPPQARSTSSGSRVTTCRAASAPVFLGHRGPRDRGPNAGRGDSSSTGLKTRIGSDPVSGGRGFGEGRDRTYG